MRRHAKLLLCVGLACSLLGALFVYSTTISAFSRSGPSPNPLPLYLHLTLTHSCAFPATIVGVAGKAISPNTSVNLLLDTTPLRTVTTNANGDFGTTVTIPATTLPGMHTVIARVPTSGTSYGTTLTVSHEWDQFGFAADHNRFNPCELTLQSNNISQLTQAWVDGLSFLAPVASVAVSRGIAYIGTVGGGSNADTLYALDTATGTIVWSFTLPSGGQINSSPAVADGLVFFGATDGNLYALNASTGARAWTDALGGQIYSDPTVANGVLYMRMGFST
jgi:outer membrane protein assembly factor BamB